MTTNIMKIPFIKDRARAKLEVGALVLNQEKNAILLAKKSYGRYKGKWTLPEGYVKKSETPAQALRRELTEELNAKVETRELVAVRYRREDEEKGDGTSIYLIFNCELQNPEELKINDGELSEFKFIGLDEAVNDKDLYSLVKVLLDKIKSNSNFLRKTPFSPPETEVLTEKYILYL